MNWWTPDAMRAASARHSATAPLSIGSGCTTKASTASGCGGFSTVVAIYHSIARASCSAMLKGSMVIDDALERLYQHYRQVNLNKFDGTLPLDYRIEFNPNLRRLTGRITYGMRLIEISRWHFAQYGMPDALATLEHELLHLYLHTLGKPSGHN